MRPQTHCLQLILASSNCLQLKHNFRSYKADEIGNFWNPEQCKEVEREGNGDWLEDKVNADWAIEAEEFGLDIEDLYDDEDE